MVALLSLKEVVSGKRNRIGYFELCAIEKLSELLTSSLSMIVQARTIRDESG
jgi:hypothetical protein